MMMDIGVRPDVPAQGLGNRQPTVRTRGAARWFGSCRGTSVRLHYTLMVWLLVGFRNDKFACQDFAI